MSLVIFFSLHLPPFTNKHLSHPYFTINQRGYLFITKQISSTFTYITTVDKPLSMISHNKLRDPH